MIASSLEEQLIGRPEIVVEAIAETRSERKIVSIRGLKIFFTRGKLTSQRRNAIHEDPESRKSIWRLEDTVECQDKREHERSNITSRLCIRKERDQHVGEGAGKDEELHEEEQN